MKKFQVKSPVRFIAVELTHKTKQKSPAATFYQAVYHALRNMNLDVINYRSVQCVHTHITACFCRYHPGCNTNSEQISPCPSLIYGTS